MEYDYIIAGAGPAGLTLAYLLAKAKRSVLILEKAHTIGGCHRVTRVSNLFSDHGPRVYSNSYVNFISIIGDMNMKFEDYFVKYNSNFTENVQLNWKELLSILLELFKFWINPMNGRRTSMKDFCDYSKFTETGKNYVDLICRLSDGGDYSRYTLYQFVAVINYQMFYPLYQPKKPLDEEFFPRIQEKLLELGVTIKTDCEIIHHTNNQVVTNTGKVYKGGEVILAIPLEMVAKLHEEYSIIATKTAYIKYVHICFHWDTKFDTSKIKTYKNSKYGIQYVIQSNFTQFKEGDSKVVISSIITRPELVKGLSFRQVKDIVMEHITSIDNTIPKTYKAILYPGNFINKNGDWDNADTSFIMTPDCDLVDFNKDLYVLGPYNKYSPYPATTLESAVANAIKLYNVLENKNMRIKTAWRLNDTVCIILLLLLLLLLR
jgi:hypothetical protein